MTNDLPVGLDVDIELTKFVRRARARSLRHLSAIHPRLDYSMFTFLLAICEAPDGIRGTALAGDLDVHKSTASRAITSLEKLGLITRIPDPDDGRAQLLVAEPRAKRDVDEYRRGAHDRLQLILEDWTPEEISIFATSLSRLNEAAEKLL